MVDMSSQKPPRSRMAAKGQFNPTPLHLGVYAVVMGMFWGIGLDLELYSLSMPSSIAVLLLGFSLVHKSRRSGVVTN